MHASRPSLAGRGVGGISGVGSVTPHHLGKLLIAGLVTALLTLGPPGAAGGERAIRDTFDDGSIDDHDPVDWIHVDGGTFDASSGDLCVTGNLQTLAAVVPELIRGKQNVSTQVRMPSSGPCSVYVLARTNGPDNYVGVMSRDGWIGIERNPGNQRMAEGWISVESDRDYVLDLDILPNDGGVSLEFRVWKEGSVRPEAPDIEAQDTNPLWEGYPGLGMSVAAPTVSCTACFRHFSATGEAPPPSVSYCDDFLDKSIYDGDPFRWQTGGGGIFDASSGDLRIAGGVGTHWAGLAKNSQEQLPGLDTVQTRVRIRPTGSCTVWIVARAQWAFPDGYNGVLGSGGYVAIERDEGAGDIAVKSGQLPGFDSGMDYGLELKLLPETREGHDGVLVQLRVWKADTENRPVLPTLEYWDPDPLPIGFPLLGMWCGTSGVQSEATFRYFCASGGVPPKASFTLDPDSGAAPLEVTADASAAAAGLAPIASYEWDFGDGETATGMIARHTYVSGGQYRVRLTVTDEEGGSSRATETVGVSCMPQDTTPWLSADIGDTPWSGSAGMEGDELRVCAAGAGFISRSDEGFFLHRRVTGPFRITARVPDVEGGGTGRRVGVMMRDSLEADAMFAACLAELLLSGEKRSRACSRRASGDTVRNVSLDPGVVSDSIWVRLERWPGGTIVAKASPDGTSWSEVELPRDAPLPPTLLVGVAACHGNLPVEASQGALRATVTDLDIVPLAEVFRRGDANGDGLFNLGDAIRTLGYQFQGEAAPSCLDAADANDDERIDISDPIYGLNHLFLGGPAPPEPFHSCGRDPTGEGLLGCDRFPPCDGDGS